MLEWQKFRRRTRTFFATLAECPSNIARSANYNPNPDPMLQ